MVKQRRWRLSALTQALSGLEGFGTNDPGLEQVPTPSTEAATILWEALARGDIAGKAVTDLGCGTGLFAIGAALLGAAQVSAVDSDGEAIARAAHNADRSGVDVRWITGRVGEVSLDPCDTVFSNPPFGVQTPGAIRPFVDTALSLTAQGGGVYLFAGPGSKRLIERSALSRGVKVEEYQRCTWPYPPVFSHHVERRGRVTVDRWILRR